MKAIRWFPFLAVLLGFLVCGWSHAAPAYPDRPITLVSPNPPGGTTDLQARALAQAAKNFLPSPIIIVNRPGGSGAVGIFEVIQSKPNGYMIVIAGSSQVNVVPHTLKTPYKGPEDYTPVMKLTKSLFIFGVQASSQWKTIKELVDYAKANPGKIRTAVPGLGSLQHISLETLKEQARVDLTAVPFAGGAECLTALLGGHVESLIVPPSVVVGQVKAGKVRVLGTFDENRHPLFPETPTLSEAGYDIPVRVYHVIIAAKNTPREIVNILQEALKKSIESESFRKFAEQNGYLIDYKGPDDVKRELERDYAFFGTMLKKLDFLKKE
jgi:tripartite-type tricarboxylate transporter receptor subunit TctC